MSEQRRVPAAIRNVAFPVARRGYERRAVDAYVTRINRLIAELEATRSPRDAVEHALERTEDERSTMLARARETAVEIIDAAEREAEEILSAARAEAASIVVDASAQADSSKAEATDYVAKARSEAEQAVTASQAEAADELRRAQDEIAKLRDEAQEWLQEVRADTERVWSERRELVDDLRALATRLQEAVSDIHARSKDAPSARDSRHTRG
ncbi:MAG: DivIVA domain-containing protein [Actinobacteria bacterium]|nr:MAG: DivIVA domain-containing protein [Actinomycetota bacterium]